MTQDTETLARAVTSGDRRALSRAITLAESTRPDHRAAARALLRVLATAERDAMRIGLSGTPGVGKSTFTEAFGMRLVEAGKRVAVLAVDPSSARSGGSILGDKTRMERLSRAPEAFIRPSPARSSLGGVARRTRDAILICEAAGFDVILVETVGVGQSETMVADMTDLFLLLLAPAGGDELQGVKRGIMEIADLILVNKADGDLAATATRTCADYAGALRLLRRRPQDPEGFPAAMTCSAVTGAGLEQAWEAMCRLDAWRREGGHLTARRRAQAMAALDQEIREGLLTRFRAAPAVTARLPALAEGVRNGHLTPEDAAEQALDLFVAGEKPLPRP
ncbi:methylmalonyl Co-A mutase-associated GTPase MeaB [Paroceanicella profunda]|uniref:Methylmalonyl Co-A mutase-associated GTPase MeaB n=1 Tax=Paroceanicella profunda TaxID=2579971 RepID=A0A5B8G1S2_9RHOB|nr:methylmalonyl Co-A mutase-associated GTPase MeaB [Paroceanicella profunda]QDL92473.1 methylmalonyl Co-A mutase-associated GTPase MeaB [Paroceanicella profunda]